MNTKIYVAYVSYVSDGFRKKVYLYAFSSKKNVKNFVKYRTRCSIVNGDFSSKIYDFEELELNSFDYSELL